MVITNSKMCVFSALFGVLLTVDLVVSQAGMPGEPVISNFVPKPTLNTVMTLTCTSTSASSSVPQITISWLLNAAFLNGAVANTVGLVTTSTINIPITARDMINGIIKCEASNSVGVADTSVTIVDVQQKPTVGEITPDAVYFDTGTTGTWRLNISDAYPGLILSSTPRWYIDDTQTFQFNTSTSADNVKKTYSYTSMFYRSLIDSDHNRIIKCEIDHPTFDSGVETRFLPMIVRYPPGHPQITTNFNNGVNENTILEGNCSSRGGYPTPTVTWSTGSGSGPGTFDVTSSYTSGSDLYVSQFRLRAVVGLIGETFTCTAENAMGSPTATVILPQVFVPPGAIVIEGFQSVIIEGHVMSLKCTSQGALPSANVIWTLPDGSLDTSYSTEQTQSWTESVNTHNYTARFEDNGKRFNCSATNRVNSVSQTTQQFIVHVQPAVPILTGPSEVYEGTAVNFTCETTRTNPAASLFWLLSTTPMAASYPVTSSTNGDGTTRTSSTINIVPTAELNATVLTCEAAHVTLPSNLKTSITIIVRLKPSIVLMPQSSENVLIASVHSIDCDVTSSIEFNVTWWHVSFSGITRMLTTENSKYIMWSKSSTIRTLSIQNYQSSDDGSYYAYAANQAGSSRPSAIAKTKGYAIPAKPFINLDRFKYYPAVGDNVVMNCSSTGGVPITLVKWYRNDVAVDTTTDSSTVNGVEITTNEYTHSVIFDDKGAIFKCEASNSFGNTFSVTSFVDVYVTPVPTLTASVVSWNPVNSVATVYEDKTYTFNGSVPRFNPKTAVIRWFVDNVEKIPNHVYQDVTAEGEHTYASSINVLMPSSLDGKNVTFMVVHPETTSRNVSVTIDVLHKPRVSVQSASGLVVKDSDFSVTCQVVSTLNFNVEWKIQGNDTKLENTSKYRITGAQGQTLTILSADYTDKVTYVCSATNNAGTSDIPATFFLVVYKGVGQPVMGGFNRNAIDGETVTVHCNSSGGDPPASIVWEKNGVVQAAPNPTFGNSDTNPVSSMLTFVVNFATDKNAVFKCTASNAYSSLTVESRFSDVYIFSNAISLTNLGILTAGNLYTVQCQTTGMYLEPHPAWMINNVIQTNGVISQHGTASDGTFEVLSNFTFIPTKDNNGGSLVCIFDHTQYTGRSINATRSLFVQFSPDEPIISGFNSEVIENTPQSLVCTVNSGNPRPTVRWFKNNKLITGTDVKDSTDTQGQYVTTNRLNFTASLQDDSSATYTCHSQHVVRNATSNVTFGQIKAPPSNVFLTLPTETLTAAQPRISNYPNLIAGKVYMWNGTVGRAQPAPILAWRHGNNYLMSHTFDKTDNVDGTVRTVSTLTYAPSVADNDIDLAFAVMHPATSKQTSTYITKLIIHGPPMVDISPNSVDIIVNSSHKVQCNVTSSLNLYTVKWFKGVAEISSSNKYSLIGNNLIISSVQFTDEGEYRCTATNAAGESARSNAVTITAISGAGEPAITGFDSRPKEGDVLQLTCTSVGGVPTPSIIWQKNNVVQDVTDSSATNGGVTTTRNTWTFTVLFADRGATLTCLATNSVANKTRDRSFEDVYIPPINGASSIQGSTTTLAGRTYTYTLNFARVNPAPGVSWSVGGNPLQPNVPPISSMVTTAGYLNATASITFLQEAEYNLQVLRASVSHPETSTPFDVVTTLTVKSSPSQPSISGFPPTNTSIIGTTLQLECTTKGGYPVPTLQWYRNNVLVGNSPSRDISVTPIITTASYNLAVVQAEKDAVFRCTAKNEINELSREVSLKDVYVRANIDGGISGDSNVIAGKNTTLTCTSTPSYPAPTVEWWMASERLVVTKVTPGTSDSNGAVIVKSEVYFVPDQADTGKTISCIVKQALLPHTATASLLITVHGPPSANAQPNSNVTLNDHVTFTCSVTSTLSTYNVTWYKRTSNTEGTRITSVNEKYAVDDSHPVYKLWIYSVQVLDNGTYYCIAQSNAGSSSPAEVSLTVYTPPTQTAFEGGKTSLTISENSNIQATCMTTVHPANTASYAWYFKDTTGETAVDASFVYGNAIYIPSADRTKAGTYICETFNSYGSDRANLTVDIRYPPELNVANVQTDFSAAAEDLVVLSCNVIANPPPTAYLWTHDNADVSTTKDLEVKVKAGEHRYTCVATNAMGSSQGFIYTIVAPQVTSPDAGASTADEGLSGGVIAAIVLGVIFIIIILIICCVGCKYYKDKKKDDKAMRTTKKTKLKHKPGSVVPDTDDRRSTLYPTREKDPAYLFGPTRPSYRFEQPSQRHYPREISAHDYHHEYSQRGGYDNTFYVPAPGSEMDDMSVYRETGFRSRRQRLPNVLPPLQTAMYDVEAKRRKDRRKKNKKRRQKERQAGEGMENPAKSKDTSPQIVLDDSHPEKDAAQDTNVLLGDQFRG